MSAAVGTGRVVAPDVTAASMTDHICSLVLRERAPLWWWAAFVPAFGLMTWGAVGIGWLFYNGVGVWGLDWPVMWGFALDEYVWWIAIGAGGTFISAMFFVLRVEWRTSINRIAETVTLFAICAAGLMPILHLGRPWLFYWLYPYPSTMSVWPQWRSPLMWDFMTIHTYLLTSIVFYYLGAIPDFASVRDRATTRGRQMIYGVLALGFRGSGKQWRHFRATYAVMAAIMAPLVVSIHSVVALDFAGGLTVGWHSTQFPPFFVFAALLSAFAVTLLFVIPLRHFMRLHPYITEHHIDVMGKLLLASSLALAYSYAMDAFTSFYSQDVAEKHNMTDKVFGIYSYVYWGAIGVNIALPQLFWFRACRLNQPLVWIICALLVVGLWWDRFEVVVMSLYRPHMPSAYGVYHGTVWDWSILMGSGGMLLVGVLLVLRYVPPITMHEMRDLLRKKGQ